ncbi:MAG TPA: IPT/TIG domain-containing protein, partial [Fodinibius sp.]|nr:IPT/TIG domain-containing protein [Fodinibius sp.]
VTVSVTVEGQTVEGPEFTVLTEGEPAFPITGSNASIEYGDRGGCGGCGITNPDNIIDGNIDNFGQVELSLGIAGSYFVRVESAGDIPAGGEAGFVMVNQGNLIGADLLNEITLTTFLDGTEQESVSGTDLLNLELVSGSTEKQFISFVTNSEFDEIEIDVGGLASLSATYEVYAAYGGREAEAVPGPAINSVTPDRGPEGTEVTITGQNFSATNGDNTVTFDGVQATVSSASETELVVEVPAGATTGPLEVAVSGQTATYEDFVVGAIPLSGSSLSVESESTLTCLACNIDNDSNIIDEDRDNFASVTIPVSVAGTASITVSNTETMAAGGQAGFILSRSGGTLDAGLLENITIETFLNGNSQETIPSTGLLLLDLLSGSGTERQFVGVDGVTTKDFDTIEIRFTQVVGADITYEVYGVFDDYFVTD